MKIVVQNFKTGVLSLAFAPSPMVSAGNVLVRTSASLISAGTDRSIIGLAKKGYLGKALDRPDLARKVINKAKSEGFWSTFKVVQNLIAEPIPLGYSAVGEVIGVGRDVTEVSVGDRVACAGLGHANHAEIISVPRNLSVPVPPGVSDEQACYVTLGAIAMHGVRQADQQFGATVLVVGLGLVGLITVQICHAAGYRVIGVDLDSPKLDLAVKLGALAAFRPDDPNLAAAVAKISRGPGVDAVLLTAGSREDGSMFEDVARLCRDRARIVVVGDIKMDISRRTYFEKELEILQSRSYGPGRYDPDYEIKGRDYPIGYVRWTERRNMLAFLDLIAEGRIKPELLTTHRFPLDQAEEAYDLVVGKPSGLTIGIVLNYPKTEQVKAIAAEPARLTEGRIGLGIIGTGQFAKGVLLPALLDTKAFEVVGVCSARGLSAETVCKRYGGRFSTSDAKAVLDDPTVAAIVIASRHDSHGRYVVEALRRGKHVFVEKPLCLTREELIEIREAAAISSGTVSVGFNRRFSPMIKALASHFADRQEPMSMSYRINSGRIPVKSEMGWVHDPAIGGGRIIGEVCHFIDTMQAVCQARPVQVAAFGVNPRLSNLAPDDICTIIIGFDDGSQGVINYWSNGDPSYPKERFEVFCQQRIAVLDNFRRLELIANNRTQVTKSMNQQKGFAEEAAAFVETCRTGRPAISMDSLLDTSLVAIAAGESLRIRDDGADEEG